MRRFSIARMMAAVLILAVSIAALRDSSEAWAYAVLTGTLLLLASAILGIAYRREARRAGWLGFALFGWGYLALAVGPGAQSIGPKLATSRGLEFLALQASGTGGWTRVKDPLWGDTFIQKAPAPFGDITVELPPGSPPPTPPRPPGSPDGPASPSREP